MGKILELLKTTPVLVSDGAWGTFLYEKGLLPGQCPDAWSVDRPDDVYQIAKSYIDAGSDMIETNSFGASSLKLACFGLEDDAYAINKAAATLSRRAAGDKLVIGSIGPSGKMLLMGDVTEDELYDSFKCQAIALKDGGADALCIETMTDPEEAAIAVRAAKQNTGLDVIATFSFDKTLQGEYRTMMGATPVSAAQAVLDAGADIIGTNCGNGFLNMIEIVAQLREAFCDVPILVHANAGLPIHTDDGDIFPDTPEDMADLVPDLIKKGANIIGGCCGTTPSHIAAIKGAVDKYLSK